MQDWAKGFYKSKRWQHARAAYLKSRQELCERCLRRGLITPATMVHHKIYLTEQNINDPRIALDFGNLEALCRQCHEEEHASTGTGGGTKRTRRYKVDAEGRVIISPLQK